MSKLFFCFLLFILFSIKANTAFANIVVNEIMYDLDGSDDGREWVEIFNGGSEQTDLSGWKFYENDTNHSLNLIQGGSIIQPGGYAVIVDNSDKFLADWLGFSGMIFDSSFSLKNTSESLSIRNGELNDIDQVVYNPSLGAGGDGNSLQKTAGGWIAAVPTPGAQNNNSSQSSQNSPPPDNPPPDNNRQQPVIEPTGGSSWPTEEQIFANAGEDRITPVGADVIFSGKALGLEKEPLDNARYSWNFGDGAAAEGQNVRHFYKYPGRYMVILDVSSGKYAASDRVVVEAIPNELKIIEANKEFIKLRNGSKYIFDISGWFLRTTKNNQIFKFPESSLISANADLVISSDVSRITAGGNGELVELLYPNGAAAFVYEISSRAPVVSQSEPVKHFTPPAGPVSNTNKFNNATTAAPILTATTASSTQENQLASVIAIADKKDFWEGKWIFLIISLSIFAAAGLFLIRRYGGG